MTMRPKVFEQEEVESKLRELGVPETSVSPTISFMRLVIPLAIKDVGHEKILELMRDAWPAPQSNWRHDMAKWTVDWADDVIDTYTKERFDNPD